MRDAEGRLLLFRYYDPRVFRAYLPTCNTEEADAVFGPVQTYIMEDENSDTLLRILRADGAVRVDSIDLQSEAFRHLATGGIRSSLFRANGEHESTPHGPGRVE